MDIGERQIEQDGVEFIGPRELQSRFAGAGSFMLEAGFIEHELDRPGHRPIVFDKQYAHWYRLLEQRVHIPLTRVCGYS